MAKNKNTIKREVLIMLRDSRKRVKNKDVIKYIFKLQGRENTDDVSTSGYYGTNFAAWERDGLIDRNKNGYKITPSGRLYIKDRQAWDLRKLRLDVKKYKDRCHNLRVQYWESVYSNPKVNSNKALNKFISSIADACNQSKLLYADMVWQEELFELQQDIVDALHQGYEDNLFTADQLLAFEYVFSKTNG